MSKPQEIKDLALQEDFTQKEWLERKLHIETLKSFDGASVAAANALAQIKEKKLFRPHKTLKEFCERECGWSKQRLFQIISFAKVRAALPSKSQPLVDSERVARALAKEPEEKREEILKEAAKKGKVTAKSVTDAAAKMHDEAGDNGQVVDKTGRPIPKAAMPYWNRRTEAQEILLRMRAMKRLIKSLLPDDPMWAHVNLNGVLGDLSNAINRFGAAVPEYVCRHCNGVKPDKCKACKGTGLLSEFMWRTVPAELK